MSKSHSSSMDDSHDSGISTEKDSEEVNTSRKSTSGPSSTQQQQQPHRRQQCGNKAGFKSLTALGARDSLESLQKLRRRGGDGCPPRRLFLARTTNATEKRSGRKKYSQHRKRFDKPNVSEVNIRKVTDELGTAGNERLVNVISPRQFANTAGKSPRNMDESMTGVSSTKDNIILQLPSSEDLDVCTSDTTNVDSPKRRKQLEEEFEGDETTTMTQEEDYNTSSASTEILHCLEQLRLGGETESPAVSPGGSVASSAHNLEEAKSAVDYGLGDVRQDFALDLSLALGDDSYAGMACSRIFDSKRRSVQWKHEVDVIYYAGDADGGKGKVIRRENEPLREEAEQQARRNRFIQLALTKNLLSNMSACQLRDPWLVVLPK